MRKEKKKYFFSESDPLSQQNGFFLNFDIFFEKEQINKIQKKKD